MADIFKDAIPWRNSGEEFLVSTLRWECFEVDPGSSMVRIVCDPQVQHIALDCLMKDAQQT